MIDPLPLALAIGAIRRAANAAGGGIRACEIEILLLVAAGHDTKRALMRSTGLSPATIDRACAYLSGRSHSYTPASGPVIRDSPFRLIQARKHPHQRGNQYQLAQEAKTLLAPSLQTTP